MNAISLQPLDLILAAGLLLLLAGLSILQGLGLAGQLFRCTCALFRMGHEVQIPAGGNGK